MKHYPEEELHAYLDGELDEEAAAEIERHLEACEACSSVVEEWRPFRTFFSECPELEHSAQFSAQVMQRVLPKDESVQAAGWRDILFSWMSPAMQFAATVLLLIFGQFSSNGYTSDSAVAAVHDPLTSLEALMIDPYDTETFSTTLEEI